MKLLILNTGKLKKNHPLQALNTYKYRSDTVVFNNLSTEEMAIVLSAAYALVYPVMFEGITFPIAEAMYCGVPVVTSATAAIQALGEDALLYADANDPSAIAEQMKMVFKDEKIRDRLINKGKEKSTGNIMDVAAALLQAVTQAAASVKLEI